MSTFVCPYFQVSILIYCGRSTMIYSAPAEHYHVSTPLPHYCAVLPGSLSFLCTIFIVVTVIGAVDCCACAYLLYCPIIIVNCSV